MEYDLRAKHIEESNFLEENGCMQVLMMNM